MPGPVPGPVPGHASGDACPAARMGMRASPGSMRHSWARGAVRITIVMVWPVSKAFQDRPAWNSVNDKKVHITIVMTWAVIWAHSQQVLLEMLRICNKSPDHYYSNAHGAPCPHPQTGGQARCRARGAVRITIVMVWPASTASRICCKCCAPLGFQQTTKKVHITIVMTWAVIWAHGQQDYAF